MNLENIWNESSAREHNSNNNTKKLDLPSIVFGRGPSIKKLAHLKLLAESNFH